MVLNIGTISAWTLDRYQHSTPHDDDFFIGIERLCEIVEATYAQIMELKLEYRIQLFGARLINREEFYNLRILENNYFLVTGETFPDYRY